MHSAVARVGIIGAGAAGSLLALRLAEAGASVRLFERDRAPGLSIPCGGGAMWGYVRELGIPEDLIDRKVSRVRLYYGGAVKEWEFAVPLLYSFRRSEIDGYIAARAVEAGAECLTRTSVRSFDCERGILSVENLDTRAAAQYKTDLVVNAAGAGGRIEGVDAGVRADTPFCVSVYVELEGELDQPGCMEFYLDGTGGRLGYFWVFPKKGVINTGVGWLKSCGVVGLKGALDDFIRCRPHLRGLKLLKRRGGVIPVRRAKAVTGRRCIAVGDAAGLVNPFTGGGLLYAQRSALIAADVLVEGIRERWSAERVTERYRRRLQRSIHWRWLQLLDIPYRVAVSRAGKGDNRCFPMALKAYFDVTAALAQVVSEYHARFHPERFGSPPL